MNCCEISTLVACIFAALIIFTIRNLDPLVFPTLYADDGGWTGLIMQHGFFHTAFNAREGFPVFGLVFLDWVAWSLDKIFSNGNIFMLPYYIYIVSLVFLMVVSVLPLIVFRGLLPLQIRIILVFILPLMTTGASGNEIYGRIANLGYLFPLICTYALIYYYNNDKKLNIYFGLAAVFLFSSLTFPVCLGMLVIWIIFELYLILLSIYKNIKINQIEIKKVLGLIILLGIILVIMPSNFLSYKGGATGLNYSQNGLIDYVFGRLLIYPFISKYYSSLNNLYTLVISFIFILIALIGIFKIKDLRIKIISIILMSSYLIYALSTAITRIGFTTWFGEYLNSFPDRYFYGINTLFVIGIIFISYQAFGRIKGIIIVSLLSTLFYLNSLLSYPSVFEGVSPAMNWRQFGDIRSMTCSNKNDGSLNSAQKFGDLISFSIYPIIDNKNSWKMVLPERIYRHSVEKYCK